ncbi:MAG TPA: PEP-CTERM sorting domain-containing protein [Pyrinomonadaceae bacterium]
MITFQRALILAALTVIASAAAPSAKADPLWFSHVVALQNDGTRIDLFSNPGATILANPQMNFLVNISGLLPPNGTNVLVLTYNETGSAPVVTTYSVPLFGTVNPPFTLLFSFTSPGATPAGTHATLTFDIFGSTPDFVIPSGPNAGQLVDSYTYSFNVAPIPEPATLLLLGTGLVSLSSRARIRRLKKKI